MCKEGKKIPVWLVSLSNKHHMQLERSLGDVSGMNSYLISSLFATQRVSICSFLALLLAKGRTGAIPCFVV